MKPYPQILTSRWFLFFRRRQQRADSPGPSCVSMKSDSSMDHPVGFKDGNPSIEKRWGLREWAVRHGGGLLQRWRGGGGGTCYGGERLWLASSLCKPELTDCFAQRWLWFHSEQCEQHKSHRIMSVQFWLGPLPYAVLNQILEGFLSMWPQVEQSYGNVTLTSL